MTQDIDQLAINTIRTLSMDAVQKANSGHPGTPMSLAPVAYELWQNHLRYDPAEPDLAEPRPLRALGRPRLDAALLDDLPRRGPQGRRGLRRHRRAGLLAAGDRKLPPAEVAHPGPPRVPLDDRGRDDHRPARPGRRHLDRDGDGLEVAGRDLRRRALRLRRLRAGGRRLPAGGDLARSRLAGRAPEARQPLLDLRQQPHLDRRRHRAGLRRRRSQPLRGLRLERAAGRRRQRSRPAGQSLQRVQGRDRPSDPDRRRQPHRLGLAEQAGHRVRPRRTARRRGDRTDQGGLRLAQGRQVPRPRRRPRALRRGDRPARRRGPRRLGREVRLLQGRQPREGSRAGDDAAARAARRLGRRPAELRGRRREGGRDPQGLEQGPERDRREGAVADRRLLRPDRLDLGPAQRRRPVRAGQLRRPPGPLRDPRTRRRRRLQRDVDGEAAPALVDLPDLLRLRPRPRSASRRRWSCRSSTSSPTTRSASARTARPISRSSSLPACGRCRSWT